MTEASPPVVETRGLTKTYKGVQALQDLNLVVQRNSIFGFLGPNGAGKTTTIKLLLGLIRLYQLTLSPWLGTQCRFDPTCSRYAAEAMTRFGVRRGVWLAAKRLGRCHPWGRSGYDPVPDLDSPAARRP